MTEIPQTICFDGVQIQPAQLENNVKAFKSPSFIMIKRPWQPDNDALVCPICKIKFGGLKRRHHCRQCGLVVCNKCCNEKIPLPQLGIEEPEKVCESCKVVTTLVTKSRSHLQNFKLTAAQELSNLCRDSRQIQKIFSFGGYHTLLALAALPDTEILGHVASGLHTLSTYEPLHNFMVGAGQLEVLCEIVRREEALHELTLVDIIAALTIFCKSKQYITKVLECGILHHVLKLCSHGSDVVGLLSVSMLSLLLEHPGTHTPIIDGDKQALQSLLALAASPSEQMQAVVLKCLNYLSMSSDWSKHRIIQEDFTAGRPLQKALKQETTNMQVLGNAVCLVANLSTSQDDQKSLHDCLSCLVNILRSENNNTDILTHVTRGLANFARFRENFELLCPVLPELLTRCLQHSSLNIQHHGLRAVLNLLVQRPEHILHQLQQDGAGLVLKLLTGSQPVMEQVFSVLLKLEPDIAPPL